MRTGDIYIWETDKARGHALRNKYHLFISEQNWQFENTFLFISKINAYKDYAISKADYGFFQLPVSFVGCEEPITYTNGDLKAFNPKYEGRLLNAHIEELINHLLGCEVMEQRHIDRICTLG